MSDIGIPNAFDLLGRQEIAIDLDAAAGYLTNKRVLVTGVGGSIGSELCQRIYDFAPAELIMTGSDDAALRAVQLSIEDRGTLVSTRLVPLDVRDTEHVTTVFAATRPQIVFHAAGLNDLTRLEHRPEEALQTNVWATLCLLHVARAHRVELFVNISTSTAADPQSVLGYSKRITERVAAYFGHNGHGTCLSVRFANILGTQDPVFGKLYRQLECAKPLAVSDPQATCYVMTAQEAVQLAIEAAAIGQNGEVLALDVGGPVRMADIAHRLADASEAPIEVFYTGLRDGEKLHESLLADCEDDVRPVNPLISQVVVPPLDPEPAWALDPSWDPPALREAMRNLCHGDAFDRPLSVMGAAAPCMPRATAPAFKPRSHAR